MSDETRAAFLKAATRQFAEKGFYGASIAGIADELGLTKQALIHHFGSKEKLYGEVLEQISDRLLNLVIKATARTARADRQLEAFLLCFHDTAGFEDLQLVNRELLDNRRRAEGAGRWYLKPFLKTLVGMVRQAPGWEQAEEAEALACVYQLLGAVSYFAISGSTLAQMLGRQEFRRMEQAFPEQLQALIRAALAAPPGSLQKP